MSSIIKSGSVTELAAVRPFSLPLQPVPPPVAVVRKNEEEERLRARIAFLEDEIRQRDASIVMLRSDVERSRQAGMEEGRKLGLGEAEDRQAARYGLLEKTVQNVRNELSGRMLSLDRLSMLLAEETLDIIFDDRTMRADLLRRILEVQIAKIDKSMLVEIEVSPEDFPDKDALAAISEALGLRSVNVRANPELASGGCTMNLRLGKMEVGLDQQWGTLRELLGDMALPGGEP